tara:strand:- start:122 stop:907 length:786 start_codon:yes stop_codon:yes gene_type:complete
MSFYIAKIFWIIINPFNLLIFFTTISLISYILNLKIRKFLLALLLICFSIFCILPTGSYLIYKLEKNFHNYSDLSKIENIDGIIIMGGSTNPYLSSIYNQIHFNDSAERLLEAKRIIIKFPKAKVIFSGGSGNLLKNKYHESLDAKIFLDQNNIDTSNIFFENNSRNTYENIIMSEKLANRDFNENWLIISSAYHLSRSINVAENIGWKLIPYPTDFQLPKKFRINFSLNFYSNLSLIQLALHEWIGIYYYYLTGRTAKIL